MASIPVPALLFDLDLQVKERTAHWVDAHEQARAFGALREAASDALRLGRPSTLRAFPPWDSPEPETWVIRPIRVRGEIYGVLAAMAVGPTSALAEASADEDRETLRAVRSHINALIGHLEILRQSSLSRLQKARLDCAMEEAIDTTELLTHETAPAISARQPGVGERAQALRVLVVEDEETNRYVTVTMLGVLGVEAEAVASGEEMLDVVERKTFDLILMDVMMPGIDGIEATRLLRQRHGLAPAVVGLTAVTEARETCLAAGMNAFIAKPARLDQISRVLDAFASPSPARSAAG